MLIGATEGTARVQQVVAALGTRGRIGEVRVLQLLLLLPQDGCEVSPSLLDQPTGQFHAIINLR